MKIEVINIDTDDVIVDFTGAFILFNNEKYGTNLKREDFTSYSFEKVTGGTIGDEQKRLSEFYKTNYFKEIKPFPYSIETINHLKRFNILYNTTSRPKTISKETLEFFTNYYPGCFSEIFFSFNHYTQWKNCGKTKAEICLDIAASLMIEDSLEYALQCAEKGVEVLLLDAPWNQNGKHKNITRVYGYPDYWKEIGRLLL